MSMFATRMLSMEANRWYKNVDHTRDACKDITASSAEADDHAARSPMLANAIYTFLWLFTPQSPLEHNAMTICSLMRHHSAANRSQTHGDRFRIRELPPTSPTHSAMMNLNRATEFGPIQHVVQHPPESCYAGCRRRNPSLWTLFESDAADDCTGKNIVSGVIGTRQHT